MDSVSIEIDVLNQLSEHTRELERLVGVILSAKQAGRQPTQTMLFDLTSRTKGIIATMIDVDHAVTRTRRPHAAR